MERQYTYNTPIGHLTIVEEEQAITGIQCGERVDHIEVYESLLIAETYHQLVQYFAGERTVFNIPIRLKGTPFQQKVWSALQTIPYGETRSYGEIATQIGNVKASRAVGGANNKNPILILVPCHRVIGANGSLVGFAGGMDIKKSLLELEGRK